MQALESAGRTSWRIHQNSASGGSTPTGWAEWCAALAQHHINTLALAAACTPHQHQQQAAAEEQHPASRAPRASKQFCGSREASLLLQVPGAAASMPSGSRRCEAVNGGGWSTLGACTSTHAASNRWCLGATPLLCMPVYMYSTCCVCALAAAASGALGGSGEEGDRGFARGFGLSELLQPPCCQPVAFDSVCT